MAFHQNFMTLNREKKELKSNLKIKFSLMTQKKDFSPTVNKLKDVPMDHIENTSQFESYLKTKTFTFHSCSSIHRCIWSTKLENQN